MFFLLLLGLHRINFYFHFFAKAYNFSPAFSNNVFVLLLLLTSSHQSNYASRCTAPLDSFAIFSDLKHIPTAFFSILVQKSTKIYSKDLTLEERLRAIIGRWRGLCGKLEVIVYLARRDIKTDYLAHRDTKRDKYKDKDTHRQPETKTRDNIENQLFLTEK